ncbi:hypothetical protein Ddye_011242 [Dipteronia dyeriana]|uniref:Reverse transcriptase domain-containing protein n=1 Tax=Dipteronia dyeriana TaxID=168575 RepID=A0AAD9UBC1_9ROSI|nr:hypothetical protein Ddye_011242 [Dipteronia dyeriana]
MVYKTVTKVLANRLKIFLPSLISNHQSAFVPSRQIFDNVLAAFETLHSISRRKTGKRGLLAIKLDMSKAYDRVEWQFLRAVMENMHFSSRASRFSCSRIRNILSIYKEGSGQQANIQKSMAIFSPNVEPVVKIDILKRSLVWGRSLLALWLTWKVGDGNKIKVFKDPCLSRPSSFRPVTPDLGIDLWVADLLDRYRIGWDLAKLHQHLLLIDREVVLSIPVSRLGGQDTLSWHYDKNGCYSVKSGYPLALQGEFMSCPPILPLPENGGPRCEASISLQRNSFSNYNTAKALEMVTYWVVELLSEFQKSLTTISPVLGSVPTSNFANADWLAPPSDLLKLNTAATIRKDSRTIGLGAVIRDDKGKVIVTRSRLMLGSFKSEIGNFLALHEDLLLAKFFKCPVDITEVDSSCVASILNSSSPCSGVATFIVNDIKALLLEIGVCKCQASPKSGNTLAQRIAFLAFSSCREQLWLDTNLSCIFFHG